MKQDLPREFMVEQGEGAQHPTDGRYVIPHPKIKDYFYNIIFTSGDGWEHLSVTIRQIVSRTKRVSKLVQRTPTWAEMCFLKDAFWSPEECVVQYHPPQEAWISNHEYCLHLWRPTGEQLQMPPKIMVGANRVFEVFNKLATKYFQETEQTKSKDFWAYVVNAYFSTKELREFPETDEAVEQLVADVYEFFMEKESNKPSL